MYKTLPLWAIATACFHIGSQATIFITPATSQPLGPFREPTLNVSSQVSGNPEALPSTRTPRPPWQRKPSSSNPLVVPPWGVFPDDFLVARQMPLKSGKREILMVSPSTGSEQRFLVNLPDTSRFEIYEVAFSNVLMNGSKLVEKSSQITTRKAQDMMREFRVVFNNYSVSSIILADGSRAELNVDKVIIKSADGQQIESFQLPRKMAAKKDGNVERSEDYQVAFSKLKAEEVSKKPIFRSKSVAQFQNPCQNEVKLSADEISTSMTEWSTQMKQSKADITKIIRYALDYGSNTNLM